MSLAEDKRDARIAAMDDGTLLEVVLESGELSETETHAFADMKAGLENYEMEAGEVGRLSKRQRAWLEEVGRRVVPIRAEDAPRGREVPTPEVLKNLPKRPPGRG